MKPLSPRRLANNAALLKWVKAVEIGDTTNGGASLKIFYAAGKYINISSTGKVR